MNQVQVSSYQQFVSDWMPYIILWGRWCNAIALNIRASTEDKIDYINDRFYEEPEHISDKFPKCHAKMLLGDFNAEVGKEDIIKPKHY
jgi:hypothetical protein